MSLPRAFLQRQQAKTALLVRCLPGGIWGGTRLQAIKPGEESEQLSCQTPQIEDAPFDQANLYTSARRAIADRRIPSAGKRILRIIEDVNASSRYCKSFYRWFVGCLLDGELFHDESRDRIHSLRILNDASLGGAAAHHQGTHRRDFQEAIPAMPGSWDGMN
jgi:hypothetical protein